MRTPRHNVPGVAYHLIWRFVDRHWFFDGDEDRAVYLRLLGRALDDSDWRCCAHALMSNHLHFDMVAGREPLWAWAKRVNSPFARWMNDRRGRLGPVMADRPKDHAIRPDREAHLIAYIHNNPVRAGVVAAARDSTWTSHRAYLGLDVRPGWLHVDEGLRRSGIADIDGWVNSTPGESGEVDVRAARIQARRRGSVELATPTAGTSPHFPVVGRPFAHVRIDPRRVVELAAEVACLTVRDLCSRRRNREIVSARVIAVHSARTFGLTGSDLASALGLSPAAVSQIARRETTSPERSAIEVVRARLEIEGGGTT